MHKRRMARFAAVVFALALPVIQGCITMPDPLDVTVAGFEPLQGEGLELRMLVKLRVQNPNDREIVFSGAAVKMDVLNKSFASGVSDLGGTVPRYGETVVEIPVTISAFRMARQVLGMVGGTPIDKVQYEMSGKLQTSGVSAVRFSTRGEFQLPTAAAAP